MASTNVKAPGITTHEGAPAKAIAPLAQLRRSVMSCVLWESEFYEDGVSIGDRIADLCGRVPPKDVCALAIEARKKMKLRHVPLWMLRSLGVISPSSVSDALAEVVSRPDELGEFLSLWNKGGKRRVPKSIRRGLGRALLKFNEYSLAKFDKNSAAYSLRDVLRIIHPKPPNEELRLLWGKVVRNGLATPDTWETQLSAGADKKETFSRLIQEDKLGALALLRNIRNMVQAGVDDGLIRTAIATCDPSMVLPFRFIAAARFGPQFEPELEQAMFKSIADAPKLVGRTIILVDVSGSMEHALSAKSDMTRMDAACGVAMVGRELCDCRTYTFSDSLVEVPARRGFALRDAIVQSQRHNSTDLGYALRGLSSIAADRIIVITDEQSCSSVPDPVWKRAYVINVASAKNGVGYHSWTHIDGFSESVLAYIGEMERGE